MLRNGSGDTKYSMLAGFLSVLYGQVGNDSGTETFPNFNQTVAVYFIDLMVE